MDQTRSIQFLGFICLLFWQIKTSAQKTDTIVRMDSLTVFARSLIGSDADSIDVNRGFSRMSSLTDLLRNESNVYFRDFGPGSSSTISMFGSKSNEVALVWNGIQVANPMLGVNDYSMITTADFTSIRVAKMGGATMYGAGSGSGAILLDQKIRESSHPVTFSAGWSTLNQFKGTIDYNHSVNKWKSLTSLSGQQSRNNFLYTNINGDQSKLPHAKSHFLNASHHSEYHQSSNLYWTMSVWARKQYREIPPAISEPRSEANQSDEFIRSVIQFYGLKPRHKLHVKAYYGFQNQQYRNPLISLNAIHRFQNGQFRMDNQWQPHSRMYVKYGFQNSYFRATSDNYLKAHEQNRISAYAQIVYELRRLPLNIILFSKPERVSGQKIGWTSEVKIKYNHDESGWWTVFANQNMVWPTLNDLYWNPGGNPDLIPEQNRMVGLSWKKGWPENLVSSMTFYYRQAHNWIQWLPTNLGFWRPVNAREGRSHGLSLDLEKNIGEHLFAKAGYQFVRTFLLDETPRHEQTIYTPGHMCSLQLGCNIQSQWEFSLNGAYTSTRYVTRDHSSSLKPYVLCHAALDYKAKCFPLSVGVRVSNLLDTNYQGIINRPMPGRQIELNTQLKF